MLQKLRAFTRSQRLELFVHFLGTPQRPTRLVDLGGTVTFWTNWGLADWPNLDVTLVNNHRFDSVHSDDEITLPNIRRLNADVLTLTPEDYAKYDVIFSNSLIEHLVNIESQMRFASTIIESARPYFLQTPNKFSPIDPHFPRPYVPFFAAYPRPLQARLLTWSGLGSGGRQPNYEAALARLEHYAPLSKPAIRRLFPNGKMVIERPLGIPMSIVTFWKPGL